MKVRPNFAEFARKADLSSRGFVSDVISGKKKITEKSLKNFKKGLGLTGKWIQLFEHLVFLSEASLRPENMSQDDCSKKLVKIKNHLQAKLISNSLSPSATIITSSMIYEIFAALGSVTEGASLSEIVKRTGLDPLKTKESLHHLLQCGVISLVNERYLAKAGHLSLEELGSDLSFKNAYLESLQEIKSRAAEMEKHNDHLFYHAALSIDRSKIHSLKASLRQALYEWIEENQYDEGDTILRITLASWYKS